MCLFLGDDLLEIGDGRLHLTVLFHELCHLIAGLDDGGMVYTSDTYEYGLMFYSFDYGFNIYAYDDHELDFNACYGKNYVADAVG